MNPERKPSGYAAILRYLYGLQYRGIKVGLKNIRALTASAGHPERQFPCFHVAGTNGKGSTASFLASILTESGYRTGLYTSPHLVEFVERIRIDGVPISEKLLAEYTQKLRPVIERTGATFFEATTCIAFQYFADQGVDVAVIETGLGGRLDATNVVTPLVSIITNVGLDHQEILGDTIRKIAREKAGIIKPGSPVVTAAEGEALEVIQRTARRLRTRLYAMRGVAASTGSNLSRSPDLLQFSPMGYRGGFAVGELTTGSSAGTPRSARLSSPIALGLPGNHQVVNAQLALAALSLVLGRGLFSGVTPDSMQKGLAGVVSNTGLRGRMEVVPGKRVDFVIDVGHNPAGIRTVVDAFREQNMRFAVAVFGAMKDKDTAGMLDALRKCADMVIIVRPRTPRAETVASLMRKGKTLGMDVEAGGSVKEGIKRAADRVMRIGAGAERGIGSEVPAFRGASSRRSAVVPEVAPGSVSEATGHSAAPGSRATVRRRPRILIIGSHYVAGEALAALEKIA